MKRLLVLGLALAGLSGCVSDYPVYEDYPVYDSPRPRIYDARPVVIYEDRYRPRPNYRYDRGPQWRYDRRDDRRYGRYDRPGYREDLRPGRPRFDRPQRPQRYDRPVPPPRLERTSLADDPRLTPSGVRPGPWARNESRVGRPVNERALPPTAPGRPRPYIPPQPAN